MLAAIAQLYGQLPLSFEANQGQTSGQVGYLSRGAGSTLFLTPTAATLSIPGPGATATAVRMQLVGANPTPTAVARDLLPGVTNDLSGGPGRSITGVAHHGQIEERGVYPGVDLTYHGNQHQLEYDFTVAPGADPGVIKLAFQGQQSAQLDAAGNLILRTAGGPWLSRPRRSIRQWRGSARRWRARTSWRATARSSSGSGRTTRRSRW